MKSKVFIFEYLKGEDVSVFMLRDGQGRVKLATPKVEEFLDYINNYEAIEEEKNKVADEMEEELNKEKSLVND